MERKAEKKCRGKHCPDPMSGNVHQSVQREEDRGDEGGKPIALIGAFAERENFSEDQNESDNNENDGDPAKLSPQPEPIAFGMDRAPVAVRSSAKNRKDVFEIAETDSNPGRIVKELKDIGKYPPTKIAGDAGVCEVLKMKSFQSLSTKDEQRGRQNQQERKDQRDPRRRALATDGKHPEPKRASGDEDGDARARKI